MAKKKKRVLAVVGSPRKKGNVDILCDRVLAGAARGGARVKKFYLHDMKIRPCSACEGCRKKNRGECVVKDDMRPLYPLLRKCDVLVIATPIYFFNMSAQTKLFLDKCYPLVSPEGISLAAKRAVICLTYGAPDPLLSGCDNAVRTFQDIFNFAQIPAAFVHASAWKKGEIKSNKAVLKQAYQTGKDAVA